MRIVSMNHVSSTDARTALREAGWEGPAMDVALGTARDHGIYPAGSSRQAAGWIAMEQDGTYSLRLCLTRPQVRNAGQTVAQASGMGMA